MFIIEARIMPECCNREFTIGSHRDDACGQEVACPYCKSDLIIPIDADKDRVLRASLLPSLLD